MSSAKCLPSCSGVDALTHWGRVTHICISKLNIIGSDNGLAPGRRQAIIWTNAGILLTGPLRTNFSEILVEINTSSYMKMHFKMSSGKWRPFYIGLSVVTVLTPLGNETWPAPPPNHSRPLPPVLPHHRRDHSDTPLRHRRHVKSRDPRGRPGNLCSGGNIH